MDKSQDKGNILTGNFEAAKNTSRPAVPPVASSINQTSPIKRSLLKFLHKDISEKKVLSQGLRLIN